MTYVQSAPLMTGIGRSDWIFRTAGPIFGLCNAAMLTAMAHRCPPKSEAPVADLLAALTAFGLSGLPRGLWESGRRRETPRADACHVDARLRKADGSLRANGKEL
jgi:hypothetical protein